MTRTLLQRNVSASGLLPKQPAVIETDQTRAHTPSRDCYRTLVHSLVADRYKTKLP
jgi:hypothetical protein